MQQLSLIKAPPLVHGGELFRGKRKAKRPFSAKRPFHLVLKAKKPILFKNRAFVEREIRRLAARFQIKAYEIAVNFDHAHLAMKAPDRQSYHGFIRSLTGLIARVLGKGVWQLLPFSRVVAWGKDFQQLLRYIRKNLDEAAGIQPYEPRKDWYRRYRNG